MVASQGNRYGSQWSRAPRAAIRISLGAGDQFDNEEVA
jgi:hypothetical protein